MIDTEIEVFRAGTRASRGITTERLASVAAFDCEANPIGICVGHPDNDTPAHGAITGFRLEGNSLFAKLKGVSDTIVNGIKGGALINRSMAFFGENDEANPTPGKLAPRHLGFLGAAAPGIPGMQPLAKALAFAAGDDQTLLIEGAPAEAVIFETPVEPTPVIIFTAKEPTMTATPTPTPTPAATPTADELAFTARQTEFAARVKRQFEAGNSASIDALVLAGSVTPAEAVGLKLAFNALDPEAEELTFGAGDKTTKATAASHILSFMAGLGKRVPIGDRASPGSDAGGAGKLTFASPVDFNAKATALATEKGITFDEAAGQLEAAAE